MNREMVYRGPDGEGLYSDGPVTLGMRRLSIIDVSGGQQPLFNEDRTLALVCNGEIYNHVELRADLVSRGHRFSTGSDCETILHLYEDLGDGCVERLRGMFAFVLWDSRNGRLLAARDRLGIKPLYLARRDRSLAFSSELKSLVRARRASKALDYRVLYQTFHHTYPIDDRRTIARDVDRVPPGTLVVVDASGIHERRYSDSLVREYRPGPNRPSSKRGPRGGRPNSSTKRCSSCRSPECWHRFCRDCFDC